MQIKNLIFLYLAFIIVCSEPFVEHILGNFDGLVYNNCTTNKGVLIQGILVVLVYVGLNALSDHGIL